MSFSPIALDFTLLVVTATVLGYLARKTRQPTLVAYILTGILLGPVAFNIVSETNLIQLMSELGLAFLLFLIGIEMNFEELAAIFKPVLRIAFFQRLLQTVLVFGVTWMLGFSVIEALVLSTIVLGSTAEVVKLLADKDEISTLPAKIDIGILLFQDIVIVFVLALLSAPSTGSMATIAASIGKVLAIIAVIGVISYLASRHVLSQHFRRIAGDDHTFFIHGVAWLFLFISVSQYLQVSVEIGAFLAGLGLGQMPYSSELRERMRPLTDFFMAVFFSSIGLSLGGSALLQYWQEAVFASVIFMLGNILILFYLIDREKFTPETSFKGAIHMAQVSEFSLVVGVLAVSQGIVGEAVLGFISLAAIITMAASSYLINFNNQVYRMCRPVLEQFESDVKNDADIQRLEDHAVIVGYNDLAERALPVLAQYFDDIVVVDRDPDNVDELTRSPAEYIFGDFKHGEIRSSTGLERAAFVLSVSHELSVNRMILRDRGDETVTFLRAESSRDAAELYDMGADYILRKNVLTAERVEDHIETYLEDRSKFIRETQSERARLWWGGRGG